jgi:hypothetical protein
MTPVGVAPIARGFYFIAIIGRLGSQVNGFWRFIGRIGRERWGVGSEFGSIFITESNGDKSR